MQAFKQRNQKMKKKTERVSVRGIAEFLGRNSNPWGDHLGGRPYQGFHKKTSVRLTKEDVISRWNGRMKRLREEVQADLSG
jgi:hypothetical protein